MIVRKLRSQVDKALDRGKSILLLGPRQVGKTTMIKTFSSDIYLNFMRTDVRQAYENNPALLIGEVEALKIKNKIPLVIIDEVQKVPQILDNAQYLIDEKKAQFILTGSSARKLKKSKAINLLPGRLVSLHLDPLMFSEYERLNKTIEELIFYGSLPGIMLENDYDAKEQDLKSYAVTYLEEEIRAESLVRNFVGFAKFLRLAALESGNIVNFTRISQDIGVSHTTISEYYQILEDCMVAERIEALAKTKTRRSLVKSAKYLIFDLGVRRLCINEGTKVTDERKGQLFEQFVGLELIRLLRINAPLAKLYFWRTLNGLEVDWVVEKENKLIPIEVKWVVNPKPKDIRHLKLFMSEYDEADIAYVICRSARKIKLADNIFALPWQELGEIL
jgi:uncharacterized protein